MTYIDDLNIWVFDAKTGFAKDIIEHCSQLRMIRRYNSPGEIELVMPFIDEYSGIRMSSGMIIWAQGCPEAYITTSVQYVTKPDGDTEVTVYGQSLSMLLERRCLPDAGYYTGSAGNVIRQLTETVFSDEARAYPNWSMRPSDGLGDNISLLTSGQTLLEVIQNICQGGGLGYATAFNPADGAMQFQLYEGEDRQGEASLSPVILDPEYDNLLGLTMTDSADGFMNVAYVLGETDSSTGITRKIVVDPALDSSVVRTSGLDRFEGIIRFGAGSVTDGSGSAIGLPPGGGASSIHLNEFQYRTAMKRFGLNRIRASNHGITVTGALELTRLPEIKRSDQADLREPLDRVDQNEQLNLGDIIRVRARSWGVDASARVHAIEERITCGVRSTLITLGQV